MTTSATTPTSSVDASLRTALSSGERPSRPSGLSASLAFGWRAILKIKHVPEQLIEVISTPVLFTLMFTYLFGGALAGSTGEYLQFLLPGTLVMTVLLLTSFTGGQLNTDVTTGVFDRFRSLPIWQPSVIVGALLGDAARNTLSSTIVVGLGLLIGFRPDGGALGLVLAVLLLLVFAFALSWVWTTLALVLRTPGSVNTVGLLILFPLTFASNTFVDPQTMPGWLRAFVEVNPVSLLVTAERDLMHGTATAGQVGWVLVASAALVAVFAPLTMYLYRNKK
ncbi:MAG: ABC transporter permease [Rubrobacteraceae bacterium]